MKGTGGTVMMSMVMSMIKTCHLSGTHANKEGSTSFIMDTLPTRNLMIRIFRMKLLSKLSTLTMAISSLSFMHLILTLVQIFSVFVLQAPLKNHFLLSSQEFMVQNYRINISISSNLLAINTSYCLRQ
jgi:hypothetical protein